MLSSANLSFGGLSLSPVRIIPAAVSDVCGADMLSKFQSALHVREKSVKTYMTAIRQFARFCAANETAQPTRATVEAFEAALSAAGAEATTINLYLAAVRRFFEWTAATGVYPNVAEHYKAVERVDAEHKKDYLSAAEMRVILGAIDRTTLKGKRDYALIALGVIGALRTVELSRANVGSLGTVNGDPVIYIQGKGRSSNSDFVRISETAVCAVRSYLAARGKTEADDPLFCSLSNRSEVDTTGGRLEARRISEIIKARFRNAGFDSARVTAHSLRHTGVTLALLSGMTLEQVRVYARHKNIQTTLVYVHGIDKARNECGAAVSAEIFGNAAD